MNCISFVVNIVIAAMDYVIQVMPIRQNATCRTERSVMNPKDFLETILSFDINKFKGSFGEILTQQFSRLFTDAIVLHDVLIKSGNNATTQIDLILVESNGLYVVEVKSFSGGTVYGDGTKKTWYYYKNGRKYNIYSPLMQNMNHIKHLKRFLSSFGSVPCYSVLVLFCDDIKVSNINQHGNTDTCICNSLIEMKAQIEKIARDTPEIYNEKEKYEIYHFIYEHQLCGDSARQKHKDRVQAYQQSIDGAIGLKLCPYCKVPLVLRNGRYGKFYGCSNYPNCSYTQKAVKDDS